MKKQIIAGEQLFFCYDSETAHVPLDKYHENYIDNTILLIFSCNGKVVTFRYIKDFMYFLQHLSKVLDTKYGKNGKRNGKYTSNHVKGKHRRVIVYVHNLKYDIYSLLEPLNKYFGIDPRGTMIIKSKIIRLVAGNYEFRDSLVLTGLSLEKSGIEYDIPEQFRKKTGDWDYSVLRTPESKITDEEMGYAINDVLALEHIIKAVMKLHNVKRIKNLPPTKTGFVRRKIKRAVKKDPEYTDRLHFDKTDETDRLSNRCYHGGIADINRHDKLHLGRGHIGDYDMTSQYPFVLCTQRYPIGNSVVYIDQPDDLSKLDNLLKIDKGFMADIVMTKVVIKSEMLSPILTNDWFKLYRADSRNIFFGSRIYQSYTPIHYSCTSVEWAEMRKYFDIEGYVVYCETFDLARLPRVFVKLILDAYAEKTVYKGDDANITKYKLAKIVVNSIYGICGTNPMYEDKTLDLETWEIRELNDEEKTYKAQHTKPQERFTDYRWAPFCTSYARHYLGRALYKVQNDVIYCDTDSAKFRNPEHKYDAWFTKENENIIKTLHESAEALNLDYNAYAPLDRFGRPHPLGVWDNDSFDGAMYAKAPKDNTKLKVAPDGAESLAITSSGINSKHLMRFYKELKGLKTPREIFEFYVKTAPLLNIPEEYSGKLTHKLMRAGDALWTLYRGDDGTYGLIQSSLAETLYPAPYQKIEKNEKNNDNRLIIGGFASIIKDKGELVNELEAEAEREHY